MKKALILFLLLTWPVLSGGSGRQAVQTAQHQVGVLCQDVQVPGYQVWGRHTKGCADFVAAVEAATGRYRRTPGDAWVATLEKGLQTQGWRAVSRREARPGDVAILHDAQGQDQHTEIVASDGAARLIGNNGDSQEMVGYDAGGWGAPTFYSPSVATQAVDWREAQGQLVVLQAELLQHRLRDARVLRLGAQAEALYREGAVARRQADAMEQQADQARREAARLSKATAKVRADLGGHAPPQVALQAPTYWQKLYDDGEISKEMLEQHMSVDRGQPALVKR